jgi:hypothetical protein
MIVTFCPLVRYTYKCARRADPARQLKKLQLSWQDIAAVQLESSAIQMTTKASRRHKISLRGVENKNAVMTFFEEHWQRHANQEKQYQS